MLSHDSPSERSAFAAAPRARRRVRRALAGLLLFGALSAFVGSILAIAEHGAGVPEAYLQGSPFSSYVVPGVLLGVVVGGTQLAAAVALLTDRRADAVLTAVAGFGMLIWIFVELAVLRQYSWLQAAYFGLGVLELTGVFAQLGLFSTRSGRAAPHVAIST